MPCSLPLDNEINLLVVVVVVVVVEVAEKFVVVGWVVGGTPDYYF